MIRGLPMIICDGTAVGRLHGDRLSRTSTEERGGPGVNFNTCCQVAAALSAIRNTTPHVRFHKTTLTIVFPSSPPRIAADDMELLRS
jgi:hypothetical protein